MTYLMFILEVGAAVAMTGGLAWVATHKPTPIRVRSNGDRRSRP